MKLKEEFEEGERGREAILQTIQDSTLEGSPAAAQMKKIAKRQTKHNQRIMLFHSLHFLVRSDSKILS
jgi:hypothetical protein